MRWIGALTAAFALVVAMATVHGAKPAASWSCSVTMRNGAGDVVTSDGKGDYINGQAGVSCSLRASDNWLNLDFATTGKRGTPPDRSLVVKGQSTTGGSYSPITTGTSFAIKFLKANVAHDVLPWRLQVRGPAYVGAFEQFSGDSAYNAGPAVAGTSSLYITPSGDGCSWEATSNPALGLQTLAQGENATTQTPDNISAPGPRVALLTEGARPGESGAVVRGYFSMPFSATIRVIAGKPGCPQ